MQQDAWALTAQQHLRLSSLLPNEEASSALEWPLQGYVRKSVAVSETSTIYPGSIVDHRNPRSRICRFFGIETVLSTVLGRVGGRRMKGPMHVECRPRRSERPLGNEGFSLKSVWVEIVWVEIVALIARSWLHRNHHWYTVDHSTHES
jgi:hypothetical protein